MFFYPHVHVQDYLLCLSFSPHFANIRRTRAALFTKFAAHLPHIKQFKESAATHYLQNFAALYLCLWSTTVRRGTSAVLCRRQYGAVQAQYYVDDSTARYQLDTVSTKVQRGTSAVLCRRKYGAVPAPYCVDDIKARYQ